jgi:hypothetical protein
MALKPIETSAPAFQPETSEIEAAVSVRKRAANRRNAQKSTGPRTAEGKARSSQNAVKLGLFSRTLGLSAALLEENPAELEALLAALHRRYAPRGCEEELMVDRMASLWWRLQRIDTVGQRCLQECLEDNEGYFSSVREMEASGVEEARLERALQRLRKDLAFVQRMRLGKEPRWGADEEGASAAPSDAELSAEPEADAAPSEPAAEPADSSGARSRFDRDARETRTPHGERSGDTEAEGAEGALPDGEPPAESAA